MTETRVWGSGMWADRKSARRGARIRGACLRALRWASGAAGRASRRLAADRLGEDTAETGSRPTSPMRTASMCAVTNAVVGSRWPALSPDRKRLAVSRKDTDGWHVLVTNLDGSHLFDVTAASISRAGSRAIPIGRPTAPSWRSPRSSPTAGCRSRLRLRREHRDERDQRRLGRPPATLVVGRHEAHVLQQRQRRQPRRLHGQRRRDRQEGADLDQGMAARAVLVAGRSPDRLRRRGRQRHRHLRDER